MGLKKLVVNVLALGPTARGFTGGEARRWVRESFRRRTRDYGYTRRQTEWALHHGFMPEQVERLHIDESNVDTYISARDYAYLRPLNGSYSKWITDKVTIHTIFKPFRDVMPVRYMQISKRQKETMFIPLSPGPDGRMPEGSLAGALALIRTAGEVTAAPANGVSASTIAWRDGTYTFDGEEMDEETLCGRLQEYTATIVLSQRIQTSPLVDHGVLHLIVFNEMGDNPVIGDGFFVFDEYETKPLRSMAQVQAENQALENVDVENLQADNLEEADVDEEEKYRESNALTVDVEAGTWKDGQPVPHWQAITETIRRLCLFVPQLEFFGAEIVIGPEGFTITRLTNHPPYPNCQPFSPATSRYLKTKVAQKQQAYASFRARWARGTRTIKRRVRMRFARILYPRGLVPYQSVRWIRDVWHDARVNREMPLREKLWAYRHGFLSHRIPQYGITEENLSEHISDFEYRWLRHINGKYRKWLEDKITVKYVCADYNDCFPAYYYHIICKNGNNKVISMMDLPAGYTNTFDEIFRLVEEKGVLALKPDEGSHGDGFYKFTYQDGRYQLNYRDVTRQEVLDILMDIQNQYLVTEYIQMHPTLRRIYDGSVNTVRMLVFKPDGRTPEVSTSYVRFGSQKTGAVDNVGAGGMTATIDVDTGYFHDAKIVEDGLIRDCPIHPDTGVPIEGYLPNWEQVKAQVLAVAAALPQIEYFGFDLAITEDGIKFPEINRFPDYPAVAKYLPNIRAYLLQRLAAKKSRYGYDVKPNRTLIHLPRRP